MNVSPKVYVATKGKGMGVVSSDEEQCVLFVGELSCLLHGGLVSCLISCAFIVILVDAT